MVKVSRVLLGTQVRGKMSKILLKWSLASERFRGLNQPSAKVPMGARFFKETSKLTIRKHIIVSLKQEKCNVIKQVNLLS